jgi:FixJ family two-component response regulator
MRARAYRAGMTIPPPRDEDAPALVAIVDDDDSVRRSMERLIRSFGYRTQVFGSGVEFLASTAPDRAACLLLDVRMPGTDGLAVQSRLVERSTRIPIVFMSALATDEEERRAWSAGAVGFLRKPVGPSALRDALDRATRAGRSPGGDTDVE